MSMFAPEILAPAGSWDSLVAAVRCGANAVYLGTKEFNARRNAANFENDELEKAIKYCHSHGTSVYVTLNTLVRDQEIDSAVRVVERVCDLGIDAVILQDLGLAKIVRELAPNMPMHASTQMSVQTLYGIEKLAELGFSRAVLPRELSFKEIQKIAEKSPIELEMFIHGALCMSVSGQCYLSAMLGGRSGNRGLCAQPCRLPFATENGTGYDLSLKDLSIIEHIKELNEAGVKSFKIEGRMKRPEYVAAAVTACRNAVNGEKSIELQNDLKAVFSRSGFTTGYFDGKLGKDMFGIRSKEDVVSAAPVLKKLERLYDRETSLIPVDFAIDIKENEKVSMSAIANGKACFIELETVPQKAISKALTKESLEEQLKKCGGTQFFANSIEIDLDEGLNLPVSVINSLRREVLTELDKKLAEPVKKEINKKDFKMNRHTMGKRQLYLRFSNLQQIPDNVDIADHVYLPLNECMKIEKFSNISAQIPRGIFGFDEDVRKKLEKCKENGMTSALCSTIDAVKLAQTVGLKVHGDFALNIFNSFSLDALEKMNVEKSLLSFELTLQQIGRLGGNIERGLIAYGRVPLMLTRNCPQKNGKSCDECKKSGKLKDRKDIDFPIECNGYSSEILNSRPIYMLDRLNEIKGIDYVVLYFTTETKQECEKIIEAYKNGEPPKGEFTRGLYYRGVD